MTNNTKNAHDRKYITETLSTSTLDFLEVTRRLSGMLKITRSDLESKIAYLIKDCSQPTNSNTKNIIIKKYADTISKLRREGYGAKKISKYLLEVHNKKVSHTTLLRYFKSEGI